MKHMRNTIEPPVTKASLAIDIYYEKVYVACVKLALSGIRERAHHDSATEEES